MADMKPALMVMLDEKGKPVWEANIPAAMLIALLEQVKFQVLSGQTKSVPNITPPTPSDVSGVNKSRLAL